MGDGAKASSSKEITSTRSSKRAPAIIKSEGPDRMRDGAFGLHLSQMCEMEPKAPSPKATTGACSSERTLTDYHFDAQWFYFDGQESQSQSLRLQQPPSPVTSPSLSDAGRSLIKLTEAFAHQPAGIKESSFGHKFQKLTMKQTKKHEKFDVKKPKKPPTAFFYFLEDFRKEFQEQNPDVKSMRDIGKACGEKWKTMTYEEKVKYYDIATEKRAEFDRAMADYIKRQESGEGEETEGDSEFEYDA
ncbi:hypothetical protein ACOSP7_021038 [Xanthoceras sorbifolium]